MTKKLMSRPMRSAKVTNQPWPPWAPPRFLRAIGVGRARSSRFGELVAVVLGQVRDQHLADERRALRLSDQQHAVDDERARHVLLLELDVQLVGDRQADEVRDERAVEGGGEGHRPKGR